MPTLLPNPFLNAADAVMPSAEQAAASPMPSDAAADPSRFDRHFDWRKFLRDTCIGFPGMSDENFAWVTDTPLFIGAPSEDFIAGFHREVLPMLETLVRRAG